MLRENPFNVTKAVDLDDKQIGDYWVDLPGSGGFKDLVKPTSPIPMIILGGKGSGKTHILRYCSYQVQRMRHESDVGVGLQKEGYMGIYLGAALLRRRPKGLDTSGTARATCIWLPGD